MPSDKEMRELCGLNRAPIGNVVEVHVKGMDFDHPEVATSTWLLITGDNKRIVANSYDGKLGRNFDPSTFTYDLPDGKKREKMLKGYNKVDVANWPAFVQRPVATPTTPETTPTTPPATGESTPESKPEEGADEVGENLEAEVELTEESGS